jgi:hypothetical protein
MKSNELPERVTSDFVELAQTVYIDACAKCTADVSDLRDLETIKSRVKHQGISFLTITLPNFCRDFERSLAEGKIDSTRFQYFRKRGLIPAFLQGLTSLIFDRETGRIFNESQLRVAPSELSLLIECVRQICLTFKKVEIDCTPQRVQSALESFIEIERSFNDFSPSVEDIEQFKLVSFMLWSRCLVNFDLASCTPKHGPGATAERISGNLKYSWRLWHDRLEPYFPLLGNAYPEGMPPEAKELELVTIVNQEQEQPVRVTPVPKTLKGPRIIAIEPCCMQYIQQGIRDRLYSVLESYPMTAGHVNFRDQSVNQVLAVDSSIDGRLATIDLSDASDRVPRSLAMSMFDSNPDLRDAIDACRSSRAEMPDGRIIGPLGKFASMGSALCFPVEAMYFYTICVVALLREQNLPATWRNCYSVSRSLYVYGDDIIIPSANAAVVLDHLQKYNCKVNMNKSFWTGRFRESCGIDAYAGYEVTPTYLGTLPPENKRQPDRIVSWTETANLFYKRGYWRTASLLFKRVERIIGKLPYVSERSEGLGRISYLGYQSIGRWNAKYHRFEIRAWVPSPVYRKARLGGYAALSASLKKLDKLRSLLAQRDPLHLERFALHDAVVLKRRWVPLH